MCCGAPTVKSPLIRINPSLSCGSVEAKVKELKTKLSWEAVPTKSAYTIEQFQASLLPQLRALETFYQQHTRISRFLRRDVGHPKNLEAIKKLITHLTTPSPERKKHIPKTASPANQPGTSPKTSHTRRAIPSQEQLPPARTTSHAGMYTAPTGTVRRTSTLNVQPKVVSPAPVRESPAIVPQPVAAPGISEFDRRIQALEGLETRFTGDKSQRNKRALWSLIQPHLRGADQLGSSAATSVRVTPDHTINENISSLPNPRITAQQDFYAYDDDQCYVDFSNADALGGGVFRNGFVQEEKMCFEVPALMYHASRGGFSPGRNPVYVTECQRVVSIHPTYYGQLIQDTRTTVKPGNQAVAGRETLQPLVTPTARVAPFHILAVAAPDLSKKASGYSYTQPELSQLYRHLLSGFTYAKTKGKTTVHTGWIGCGAFQNNKLTMASLQLMAAKQAGVNLVFHTGQDKHGRDAGVLSAATAFVASCNTADEAIQRICRNSEGGLHFMPSAF